MWQKPKTRGNLPHLGRKVSSNNISAISKSDYFCSPGSHARKEVFSLTLRLAFFIAIYRWMKGVGRACCPAAI